MTKQTHEYFGAEFSGDFFEFDPSKHRTATAVPFHQQGLEWHFADYEKPEFHAVDELDSIFRYVAEIDRDLAENFAAEAKANLDELVDEINERLHHLIRFYTLKYSCDEEYVEVLLCSLHNQRAKTAA